MLADYMCCDCMYVPVLADYMWCDCMYVPVVKCVAGNQFAITLGKGVS